MEKIKNLIIRFSRWQYCGLAVLVLALFILHLSVLYVPNQPLFDELHYVPDARLIMQGAASQRPEHTPLSKLFIVAGMELFGDNPVGWRFFPIVFSTGSVVFFYLICRRLNLSPRISYIATFLFALENLSFIHGHIAMLDVFYIFFMILSFWLYLKERYVMSGLAIGLSALAKLTGVLSIVVIGLHWMLTGGLMQTWQQLLLLRRLLVRSIKHRCQLTSWLFIKRVWHRMRFLPSMLAVPIAFMGLMPLMDYGVFHQWINPIDRMITMMKISGSITYDWVEASTGSRPWMWLLVPEKSLYWYMPHYNGMISPTLWVFIMPLVLYILYKAIRGNTPVLFPLCWFIGTYLVWIPISLVTNRVTYIFYFYPTVGAIAIGLAIATSPLLNRIWGRVLLAAYMLAHAIAFIVISPVALYWSIPLCLLLYIFIFWLTRLGEGLRLPRRAKPIEMPADNTPEALVEAPVDKPPGPL